MRHEINMYNPAAPGACWVMECQECFGAVLITRGGGDTLDYPLVNTPLTSLRPPPHRPDYFHAITARREMRIAAAALASSFLVLGQFEQKVQCH